MSARFEVSGLVVHDVPCTLALYRRLGLDIPAGADAQDHVEAPMPGGLRMAWDIAESVCSS